MQVLDEKIISLSKTKILKLMLISLAFLGVGVWLLNLDVAYIQSMRRYNNPLLVHGVGLMGILLGSITGLSFIIKLFDKRPGFIISNLGITHNTGVMFSEFIAWSEITGFDVYQIKGQKMLVVLLNNPSKYIATGSFVKRFLSRAAYRMYGRPVTLSTNSLKINFDELFSLCNQYLNNYGKRG